MHDDREPRVLATVQEPDQLRELPTPGLDDSERWVATHLDGHFSGAPRRSDAFVGGQQAADSAMAALDIGGYAKRRSQVWPPETRGASKLSPYIRHGLIDLPTVHDHPSVQGAHSSDRFRFRGELLWQDYSRHWYAAFGTQTRHGVVYRPQPGESAATWKQDAWWRDMKCVDANLDELHTDGWMVNQTRMWLASQWSVRAGADWRAGEDEMFRHLLDGSRAANRNGWQWVVGGLRSRSYGFARRQVARRAPEFCASCSLADACPIGGYPGSVAGPMTDTPTMSTDLFGPGLPSDPTLFDSPRGNETSVMPEAVWLTAESLGDADPALAAHPDLPVHFVLDAPLLRRLGLDGKRLVFLTDCLADLAQRRDLTVWLGRPRDLVSSTPVAVTHAPVPGFARITADLDVRAHPWKWLRPPTPGLLDRLALKRFPSFKDWCRITKPASPSHRPSRSSTNEKSDDRAP